MSTHNICFREIRKKYLFSLYLELCVLYTWFCLENFIVIMVKKLIN